MQITNKTKKYPCTGYFPTAKDVRFAGAEGLTLPILGEIKLISEDNNLILAIQDCADYARQTYIDGVLTLTNEPEPAAPTSEELLDAARAAALARIEGKCSAAIESGITLDGKHYRLNDNDQKGINAAVALANAGVTEIPFAADGEALTMYSVAQILAVGVAAYKWVLAHKQYRALLEVWRQRETDLTVLGTIDYGKTLPDDLMQTLTADLTAAGIDAAALAAMLTA